MAARSSVLIFFPFGNVNICARLIDGFQIVKKCTRYLEMNSKAYKYVLTTIYLDSNHQIHLAVLNFQGLKNFLLRVRWVIQKSKEKSLISKEKIRLAHVGY